MCDPHRFVLRFKVSRPLQQTFKEKRSEKKPQNTTMNKSYAAESECDSAAGERDGVETETPLWSFDGALSWNTPLLDLLLNPSSVELITARSAEQEITHAVPRERSSHRKQTDD